MESKLTKPNWNEMPRNRVQAYLWQMEQYNPSNEPEISEGQNLSAFQRWKQSRKLKKERSYLDYYEQHPDKISRTCFYDKFCVGGLHVPVYQIISNNKDPQFEWVKERHTLGEHFTPMGREVEEPKQDSPIYRYLESLSFNERRDYVLANLLRQPTPQKFVLDTFKDIRTGEPEYYYNNNTTNSSCFQNPKTKTELIGALIATPFYHKALEEIIPDCISHEMFITASEIYEHLGRPQNALETAIEGAYHWPHPDRINRVIRLSDKIGNKELSDKFKKIGRANEDPPTVEYISRTIGSEMEGKVWEYCRDHGNFLREMIKGDYSRGQELQRKLKENRHKEYYLPLLLNEESNKNNRYFQTMPRRYAQPL